MFLVQVCLNIFFKIFTRYLNTLAYCSKISSILSASKLRRFIRLLSPQGFILIANIWSGKENPVGSGWMTADDDCGQLLAHKWQIQHLEQGCKAKQSSSFCFYPNANFFRTKGENVKHAFCWLEHRRWWKATWCLFEKRLTLRAFSGG